MKERRAGPGARCPPRREPVSGMTGNHRSDIKVGARVKVVQKQDQRSGRLTRRHRPGYSHQVRPASSRHQGSPGKRHHRPGQGDPEWIAIAPHGQDPPPDIALDGCPPAGMTLMRSGLRGIKQECHARENGHPSWIPSFEGMTNENSWHQGTSNLENSGKGYFLLLCALSCSRPQVACKRFRSKRREIYPQ